VLTVRHRRATVPATALALAVLAAVAGTSGAWSVEDGAAVTGAGQAAKQKSSISVLPPISQAGKRAASARKAKVVVSAVFKPAKLNRPVVLMRKSGGGWKQASKTKLTKTGLAEFSVPTKKAVYRATALRFKGLAPVNTKTVKTTAWGTPDFRDEFAGSALSASWSHRVGFYNPDGLRNCAKGSPSAVGVSGGALRLSVTKDPARPEPCTAYRADGSRVGQFNYRLNGHISTDGVHDFTYGVAAARMKFQELRGQHASFWLQPTTIREATTAKAGGSEIDIIEWFGDGGAAGGLASFIYHPSTRGPVKVGGFIEEPDSYLAGKSDRWWKQYHVFSVEWTRKAHIFRIDGRETWRTSAGISGQPQYPILSLLSSDYELENLPREGLLPQHMYVDWVQVWEGP